MNNTRVITAIWMGLIIIPFMFFGGVFFYGLIALLAFIATYELVKMHNDKYDLPKILNVVIPLFSVIVVIIMGITEAKIKTNYYNIYEQLIFALLVIFFFLFVIPLFYKQLKITDGMFYIGSILYGGVGIGMVAVIRNINIASDVEFFIGSIDINVCGLALMGYVLLSTMFTDIGAYEIGCRFGKHKLIPDVSPNKTIEGAVGGIVCGSIAGTLELLLTEHFLKFNLFNISNVFLNVIVIFILSLVLTIVCQIGDLCASKLKREYGIKDYGKIFPGHGGVMDRFDSLIMTCTFFFIILALFGVTLW